MARISVCVVAIESFCTASTSVMVSCKSSHLPDASISRPSGTPGIPNRDFRVRGLSGLICPYTRGSEMGNFLSSVPCLREPGFFLLGPCCCRR